MTAKPLFRAAFLLFLALPALAGHVVSYPSGIDGTSRPLESRMEQCRAEILDVTSGWGAEDVEKDAGILCNLRKKHQAAKEGLLKKLQALVDEFDGHTNHGRDAVAIQIAEHIAEEAVPQCMEAHDQAYVCHNTACLFQGEVVRMDCYEWAMAHPSLAKSWRTMRLLEEGMNASR